jgi:glycosyltransferase involved in cell wall biosynthesis
VSTLSVIVITKNEERNIRECLDGVRWADEIVVVDGGSTDGTVDAAKAFTSKVYVRPWEGYGPAKNFALSQCTSEWILWLDADERVTEDLKRELQSIVRSEDRRFVAYEVPRRANFLGRWINHCGWYPGYVTRIFRRGNGTFTETKVHESLKVEGGTGRLKSDLLHYTDPNLFHYFEKFNRYTTLAAADLRQESRQFRLAQLIFRPLWQFIRMNFVKRGFLDGVQGFILCVLSSVYVFTKYAKFWELTTSVDGDKL